MVEQSSFKFPKIDREKTKEVVEAMLKKYRFYLLTVSKHKL
ncbi:MAG TPA: hypothetical protein VEY70_20245 [Metabacillus sp.]|nr:hypothetical protein [Metabacillus sp.]